MTKISIIIPTRNRARYLARTLSSIISQKHNPSEFEIIIVDNASTDETKKIVNTFIEQNLNINIKYYFEPNEGLHYARHKGYSKSKGLILGYIDDDVILNSTWIGTAIKNFEKNPKLALLGGKVLPKFETTVPHWIEKLWHLQKVPKHLVELSLVDLGTKKHKISPYLVFGCNFIIKKKILEDANGFNPDGFPLKKLVYRGDGETAVSRYIAKRNLLSMYDPSVSLFHIIPSNRLVKGYFYNRHYSQGISDSYTDKRDYSQKLFLKRIIYRGYKLFESMITIDYFSFLCNLYYVKGYLWHCYQYLKDSNIRIWVHKANYLNE